MHPIAVILLCAGVSIGVDGVSQAPTHSSRTTSPIDIGEVVPAVTDKQGSELLRIENPESSGFPNGIGHPDEAVAYCPVQDQDELSEPYKSCVRGRCQDKDFCLCMFAYGKRNNCVYLCWKFNVVDFEGEF
jgi:hypothetical protein